MMWNGIQVVIEITRDVYWVPFIKHSVFSLHVSQIRVVMGVCEITVVKYCSIWAFPPNPPVHVLYYQIVRGSSILF